MAVFDANMVAELRRITVYPIKALDGLQLDSVWVNPSGALYGDRQFAMVDDKNGFINGKRYPLVNQINAKYGADMETVTLSLNGLEGEHTFELYAANVELLEWLSDALALRVELEHDLRYGFPDSTGLPGPTIISQQTYVAVKQWFPQLDLLSIRRRFRANLEIDGVPAFWEDGLPLNGGKTFVLGELRFASTKLCDRCQVPTQDPDTGEIDHAFQARFMRQRAAMLPSGINPYTLSVKTRLLQEEGGELKLGARLEVR